MFGLFSSRIHQSNSRTAEEEKLTLAHRDLGATRMTDQVFKAAESM
jgi:hypothetical protein